MNFYNKGDIKKLTFAQNTTENKMSKRSFVETFLSSVKQKMYGGKKR